MATFVPFKAAPSTVPTATAAAPTSIQKNGTTQYLSASGKSYSSQNAPTPTTPSNVTPTGTPVPSSIQKPSPPVISGNKGLDTIKNTLVPAMNEGNQAITQQNTQNQNDQAQQAAATHAQKAAAKTTPPPIPDIPQEGNQFAYHNDTGEKMQIPTGTTPPANYSTNPPANPTLRGQTPVGSQVQANNGNTYQQYSDGTYGQLDPTGKYLGAVDSNTYNLAAKKTQTTSRFKSVTA